MNPLTKTQKLVRIMKLTAIHTLILISISSVIYAHTRVWVAEKEKAILRAQLEKAQEPKTEVSLTK
jgi:hypothetical protein